MNRPIYVLLGCLAVGILGTAQIRGDDADQTRKALQEVSDTVGDQLITLRIEALRQNPDKARELVRYGAKLARDNAPPLNYTSAYVLASAARELKDVASAQALLTFCAEKAAALKSDRKSALAFLLHLVILVENQETDAAAKLAVGFAQQPLNGDDADDLSVDDDQALIGLLNDLARHKEPAQRVVQAIMQQMEAWQKEEKEKRKPINSAAIYLLANLARQIEAVDDAERLLRFSVDRARTALERRLARLRLEGRMQAEDVAAALNKLTRLYMDLLDLLFEHERFDATEKLAKEILELPYGGTFAVAKAHAITRNIQALALQGRTDDALKQLEPFLKRFPDDIQMLRLKASVLLEAGRSEEAAQIYENLLVKASSEETKDQIRYLLSGLYMDIGRIDKAIQQLRILIQKHPDNATYNNDLGYMLAEQDMELDEAERLIRKALEKEPNRASYIDSLGWVLYKKGKHKEAKEQLLRAIRDPEGQHAEIYDHLGDIHWALGEKEDAVAAWKKALKLIGKSQRDQKRKEEIEKKLMEREQAKP
jgi:Tfp pilus assembly protein PilF